MEADARPDLPASEAASVPGLRAALVLPALLLIAGAFLPGRFTWGFNAFSYLPRWALAAFCLLLAALAALWLPSRPLGGMWLRRAWEGWTRFVAESRSALWVLPLLSGVFFWLLRSHSFFMGDGPLFEEMTEKGVPLHGFDDIDYLLHAWLYRLVLRRQAISPLLPYQAGSILAGVLAVFLSLLLIRRLDWEPWRKALVLGWLGGTAPVALYCGYVEVYSFIFVFLTAFLVAGLAALQGRASPWWAGLFFGLAMLFQLTAVFSVPALLFLLWKSPAASWKRRIVPLALPTLCAVLLWLLLHVVLRLDQGWFRRGFLENEEARTVLVRVTGAHGLFSGLLWKDLLNLALLTAPVPALALLLNLRGIRSSARRPQGQFLLVQVGSLLLLGLFIDRKLGMARDWDLMAAHTAGLMLLAALVWPTGARRAAPAAAVAGTPAATPAAWRTPASAVILSLLITLPWLLLLHRGRDCSRWLADAAVDFGDPAKPYAYEVLGRNYRLQGDYEKAEEMYRLCVQASPDNARFRVLLGTTYAVLGKTDQARREYQVARERFEAALRANPGDASLKRRLAQVLSWQGEDSRAADLYLDLTREQTQNASLWEALGRSALAADRLELAARALSEAHALDPRLAVQHDLGVAWMGLGRYTEAADAFRRALSERPDPSTRLGLALALVSEAQESLRRGQQPSVRSLDEAEEQVRGLLRENPGDGDLEELARRLQLLRRGVDPDAPLPGN